jgi:alkylated DNA repair dioxygenase AlkB
LTAEEEVGLIGRIDASLWRSDLKRRVQHYGYRYDYRARVARESDFLGPLPSWLDLVLDRLCAKGVFIQRPDQVIVNEYLPGQGISAHVDCEPCFGDCIASVSLLGGCMMDFARLGTSQTCPIYLEPRSLVVLRGAARKGWTHAIAARKSDPMTGTSVRRTRRVSLTFRTMRFL